MNELFKLQLELDRLDNYKRMRWGQIETLVKEYTKLINERHELVTRINKVKAG